MRREPETTLFFVCREVRVVATRKSDYWLTDDGLLRIQGWARDGLTDEQIAKNMNIAYSTMRVWKDKYQAMSAALKESKDVADREVENALFRRALGYVYEEKTFEPVKDPDTDEVEMKCTKIVKKEVVADTTAQIFWLKNRKPKEWRDRVIFTDDGQLNKIDELIGSIDKLADQKGET